MQDATQVPETGAQLSQPGFTAPRWYKATVPGTVLTTLVNNGVYPEPLYGENNRPGQNPGVPLPDGLVVSHQSHRPRRVRRQADLAEFRGHQLRRRSLGQRREGGRPSRVRLPAGFSMSRPGHARPAGRAGRPRFAAAPSRHPFRANHRQRPRPQRRPACHGRPDVSLLHRLGLDSRHPRPQYRHLAEGHPFRLRPAVLQDPFVTTDLPLPSLASRRCRHPDERPEPDRPAAKRHPEGQLRRRLLCPAGAASRLPPPR